MSRSLRRAWLVGGRRCEVDVRSDDGRIEGTVADPDGSRPASAHVRWVPPGTVVLRVGDRWRWAVVARRGSTLLVALDGRTFELEAEEAGKAGAHAEEAEPFAVSPMTGVVVKVQARPGAAAAAGAPLFVVEAMKMEFVVRAPRDLTVAEVRREAGQKVSLGEVVVTFAEGA